jgi:hypothetical protein
MDAVTDVDNCSNVFTCLNLGIFVERITVKT